MSMYKFWSFVQDFSDRQRELALNNEREKREKKFLREKPKATLSSIEEQLAIITRTMNYNASDVADRLYQLEKGINKLPPPPTPVNAEAVTTLIAAVLGNALGIGRYNLRKIEAVKAVRSLTGMGLKESKDYIEQFWIKTTDTTQDQPVEFVKEHGRSLR